MTTKTKVKCPYADKCIDEGTSKCQSCLNNDKRSYYRPSYPDCWYLYQPYYPYWEPWKITYTTGTGDDLSMPTTSYYQTA